MFRVHHQFIILLSFARHLPVEYKIQGKGRCSFMVYNVYNYLVSDYVHQTNTQYKAHNNSELKSIYNKIVKMGQKTPLYLFRLSDDVESFSLGLKESSIGLSHAFSDLTTHDDSSVYSQKTVHSENTNIADAAIVSDDYSNLPAPFLLEVHTLAKTQKNLSNAFYADYSNIPEGNYYFTIETDERSYEYKLQIPKKASNKQVFERIASSINHGKCGIHATVTHDKSNNQIQLALESDATGTVDDDLIFDIFDSPEKNASNARKIVSDLGLNRVVQKPENSSFSINGEEKSSINNQFTLQHSIRLSLNSVSDTPIQISYQADCDKILSKLNAFIETHNFLVDFTKANEEKNPRSSLFIKELQNLFLPYKDAFQNIGISLDDDTHLSCVPIITNKSILDGSFETFFSKDNDFVPKFYKKLNRIILNPIEYIDKTVVTYPNPIKPNFPSPYITSIYSGMLFNNYC